ncbi:aminotransferase class III-fold pyridoxal phosphate-dependent enzyme [Neorhizobium petrolearium]|uniref:Aminotransferase class III-fold pyridoxal phosphate-dependent enzyme n=1 Tax=Neorhizobium petrolearium TaxID=515361 RepID=A0ABY8M253_9HYPH|nr:aminotransferase class III-fold pyridoxal phosphate-dependent enzyme [Neorhizobium petrolearium]MCC2612702.1 aminotransferase class III-fold pyridoxal phosphate-dependent enzyme [Neorhizobium petrolearium]WGI67824.1 aminotransferase class III-fold pyridoxal phosphate-dependent enzyme [Neorhizobium petrolearium]
MSDVMPDLIDVSSTGPSIDAVEEILREQYGLSGQVFPIEGRKNPYFLIDNGHMRYLLKVAPADWPLDKIETEHALMRHILREPDGPHVPEPVSTKDGNDTIVLPLAGEDRRIRLLTFLDGTSPQADEKLSDEAIAAFGAISASLAKSLEDFEHSIPEQEPESDLRKAGPQTVSLLSAVADQETRDIIAKAMVTALRRIQPLAPGLRTAVTHQNLDADAVIGEMTDGIWLPTGLTDFTGLSNGWLVAGLANSCAYMLANRDGDPSAPLPAIRAYHDIYPLTLAELEALWPLIVARTGILSAKAENRRVQSPDDQQVQEDAERRRAVLHAATTVSPAWMFAAILDVTKMTKPLPEIGRLLPDIDPDTLRLVDLSVTSPLLYGGNWTDPENDWKLLARVAWETGRGSTRYGEYRLSKSSADPLQEPENFSLHIDACVPTGTTAVAPFGGTVKRAGPRLVFAGRELTLHVEGLECEIAEETKLDAGEPLGMVAGAENAVGGIRLRFCRDPDLVPPHFCIPGKAGTWSHLCPSPAALLGTDADAPDPKHPDQPVRGWKEYLFDGTGRSLLDLAGNAPLIGHGDPGVAAAAYRQLLLLNTPPAGPSEAEQHLSQRLEDLAPEGLMTVLVLPSHRDALDHALNVARAHTGRHDIVGVVGLVPKVADDAMILCTSSREEAAAALGEDGKAGLLLTGFPHPADSLSEILNALARNEGLLVIDETSTGWGRLGHHAWGFEASGLRPDLVIAGLPGEDIAVLFMRETIAASLELTVGRVSPVACTTAATALEISEEEALRENARLVGDHLKSALQELAARHPAIRAVQGMGLCLALVFEDDAKANAIGQGLRKDGILTASNGRDELMIAPPLCFSRESADLLAARLKALLSES